MGTSIVTYNYLLRIFWKSSAIDMEINTGILIKNFCQKKYKGVYRLVSYVKEHMHWTFSEGAFICYPVAGIFFIIIFFLRTASIPSTEYGYGGTKV